MNTDIRIAVSFRNHRKRRKLSARLGPEAVLALIDLWIGVGVSRPSGVLDGWDAEDIALEAGWDGEPQEFVSALEECGWLEHTDGVYRMHDWDEHQPWAVEADERSEKARKAARARWSKEKAEAKREACSENATCMPQACGEHANSNAPLLSYPNLSREEERHKNKADATTVQVGKQKKPPSASTVVFSFVLPGGDAVHLQAKDRDTWKTSFREIDVDAELQAIADKPADARAKWTRKNWFGTCAAWLRMANQRAIERRRKHDPTYDPDDPDGSKKAAQAIEETRRYCDAIEGLTSAKAV